MTFTVEQHDRAMEKLAKQFETFKVNLEPSKSGDWEIDNFEVVKGIAQMRCAMDGRPVPLGKFTRLSCRSHSGLFMTDTPAELNDARDLFWVASGHVLITGLGIGMVPRALFNPEIEMYGGSYGAVDRITIVEKEKDVIDLVANSLGDLPVEVVHADAFDWEPPKGIKFDYAWHDIWPTICSDNLPQVAKLRNHYKRHMVTSGRQLVWAEAEMKSQRRMYG
jgi:hypothetical protein